VSDPQNDYRARERAALQQCAVQTLADPTASAQVKAIARERLLRTPNEQIDPRGLVARLTPAQVRRLRELIRALLDGTLVLDDDGAT
jgi:hypothetical protein